MDRKTVAENKAWYTLQGWPFSIPQNLENPFTFGVAFQHSPESGDSVSIRIFVHDIILCDYNAVVRVTVGVTRYSREMVFQEVVLYALTMWRSIETIWYSARVE